MSLAPIVLFVYNRPDHTLRTLESLMQNDLADQSEIFIYCDGAKDKASEGVLKKLKEVRAIIRLKQWCAKVNIFESEKNQTHPVNLVTRVTEIVNRYGKIIVLEDDLVLGKGFLKYMNEALDLYETTSEVMHVSGYSYPVLKKKLPETFFLHFISSWGWATWKRAWDCFIHDAKALLDKISKEEIHRFNLDGGYDFYSVLNTCASGSWKSWDVRWYSSFFIRKGLGLYPHKSLVRNIGHDSSGMHCEDSYFFNHQPIIDYVSVSPIEIKEERNGRKAVKQLFLFLYDTSFFSFNNFKKISRKIIFPKLYNYLKKKKNEYLLSKMNHSHIKL